MYMMDSMVWVFMVLVIALIFVLVFLRFIPVGLWITSLAAGVHVSIASLVGMRLRRIQPKRLVEPLIKARKAGLDMSCWSCWFAAAASYHRKSHCASKKQSQ